MVKINRRTRDLEGVKNRNTSKKPLKKKERETEQGGGGREAKQYK